jgi:eukaryotic-like serine/threonine-protein kinase
MKRLMRAPATPGSSLTTTATRMELPLALMNKSVNRLCWVTLLFAVTTMAMFVVQWLFQPEIAKLQREPQYLAIWAGVLGMNIAFAVAHRRGTFAPAYIMMLATFYEIAVSFGVSMLETAFPFDPLAPVRGVSVIALWITMCGLMIPNTPRMTMLASLGSAATWPLAYFINLQVYSNEPLPFNRLIMWIFPTVAAAFWAYFLNKRIFHMEMEMERQKEMGSYELEAMIGKGGMGEVWRARHRLLAREAAIKLIRTDVLAAQTGRAAALVRRRFEAEAKATAALRSPHTVSLYDYGPAEDGSFYYAMELLDGIDLESLVKRYGPLPPERVAHILTQACDSLEEAHRSGLIHRDVKPTNLFVCRVGMSYDFVKVLDFGLVKTAIQDGESRMTKDGMTTGTPAYMAPEIALGKENVDGRVDIYGLGCVAYYLLTGQLVFDEPTATAQALAHVQKDPQPISLRTEMPIPESLERIIMSCLAKDPADRPRSAQALSDELERAQGVRRWSRENAVSWWQLHHPTAAKETAAETAEAEVQASLSEVNLA